MYGYYKYESYFSMWYTKSVECYNFAWQLLWRSDLSKIEVLSETQFIEYTKDGYATTFTITATEPFKRWEFDIENDNIKGHWIGLFSSKGKETTIDFTESVIAKKLLMKPFVKSYLKKQQLLYVADLKNVLLWQTAIYQRVDRVSLLK